MISVVIPLYNKEKQIAATLQSVLQQSYQNFEIVIVNDGSTDNSVAEVTKISDRRIRLIHQENAGVSAARNKGIAEAKHELIAFLDADDEWRVNYLQTQYELFGKYLDCSVFACNYEYCDIHKKITPTILRKLPFHGKDGVLSNYFEVASCSHPPLWTSAVMVKKAAIQSIGGFPVGIKSGEDLLTWARLAARHKIAFSIKPEATFIESPSDNSISKIENRSGSEEFILKEFLLLYQNEQNETIKKHLKSFILRWYKIYAVILIETKKGKDARKIAIEAIKFGGKISFFLVICLTLLPNNTSRYLFYKLR